MLEHPGRVGAALRRARRAPEGVRRKLGSRPAPEPPPEPAERRPFVLDADRRPAGLGRPAGEGPRCRPVGAGGRRPGSALGRQGRAGGGRPRVPRRGARPHARARGDRRRRGPRFLRPRREPEPRRAVRARRHAGVRDPEHAPGGRGVAGGAAGRAGPRAAPGRREQPAPAAALGRPSGPSGRRARPDLLGRAQRALQGGRGRCRLHHRVVRNPGRGAPSGDPSSARSRPSARTSCGPRRCWRRVT